MIVFDWTIGKVSSKLKPDFETNVEKLLQKISFT